jgi:acyl carrier protein
MTEARRDMAIVTADPSAMTAGTRILKGRPSMTQADIAHRLEAIFQDIFGDPDLRIKPDMTADDIEDWDSARMVELIIAVESTFRLKFTTRETDSLKNVGDFIDLITRKAGVASA